MDDNPVTKEYSEQFHQSCVIEGCEETETKPVHFVYYFDGKKQQQRMTLQVCGSHEHQLNPPIISGYSIEDDGSKTDPRIVKDQ